VNVVDVDDDRTRPLGVVGIDKVTPPGGEAQVTTIVEPVWITELIIGRATFVTVGEFADITVLPTESVARTTNTYDPSAILKREEYTDVPAA
jgi:hypothetical protein